MRSQSKHFVVEVKRGTSRAAFTSPDSVSEKFGAAEQALFGGPVAVAARAGQDEAEPSARPAGRVLRSLIEPPPPVVVIPEPPRRGRKPGSRNRPKQAVEAQGDAVRPAEEVLTFLSAPPFDDFPASDRLPDADDHVRLPAGDEPLASGPRRPRLRDRSTIIKRYVLGTEARPGEGGRIRARRLARKSGR